MNPKVGNGVKAFGRPFARLLVVAIAGLGSVAVLLYLAAAGLCGNQVIEKADAPDGLHVAYLFRRDYGATTSFTTQASILPGGNSLSNDKGNIFIADLHGEGPTGYWGGPIAHLRWQSRSQLEIRYHHSAKTYVRKTTLGTVVIRYIVD